MYPSIDLHTHSTASDGTLSPAELVRRAALAGVEILALTDHDTTEGVAEASEEAVRQGVALIPGVEISVTWAGLTVHIVGVGVDRAYGPLQEGLARLRAYRDWRAQEIDRRLARDAHIGGTLVGARALSSGRLVSRTHFARHLVARGVAPDVRSVFRRYLVSGKPGHVAGDWAGLEEAVAWIRGAGGQAVIAHPARYRLNRSKLHRLVTEFVCAGGEGMEVVSGSHSADECFTMARDARALGLLASAGSDYHGPEDPWVHLGCLRPLPPGCTPLWKDWPIARMARRASS
jgi:predicted metal-dependent phosphoesterase TrpH